MTPRAELSGLEAGASNTELEWKLREGSYDVCAETQWSKNYGVTCCHRRTVNELPEESDHVGCV